MSKYVVIKVLGMHFKAYLPLVNTLSTRCELREAPSPLYFTDTALNPPPPSDLPGIIHQVYVGTSIALEEGQLNGMHHVASNTLETGRPIDSNCLEEV